MSLGANRLLEMLSDGKWHEIDQLEQDEDLNDYEVEKIVKFLDQYDFVEIDENKHRVRIDRDLGRIIKNDTVE
jgi:hypothetical protein